MKQIVHDNYPTALLVCIPDDDPVRCRELDVMNHERDERDEDLHPWVVTIHGDGHSVPASHQPCMYAVHLILLGRLTLSSFTVSIPQQDVFRFSLST